MYLKLYRTNKITMHLCSIRFRKDLQAEAERKKKQNRKDSDPPGELSNRWATCSDQSVYSINLLHIPYIYLHDFPRHNYVMSSLLLCLYNLRWLPHSVTTASLDTGLYRGYLSACWNERSTYYTASILFS